MRGSRHPKDNEAMSGIHFVTDEKGRKVAVQIDLKKHGAIWKDFWDGLVSVAPQAEGRSLRTIPREPPKTHSLAKLGNHSDQAVKAKECLILYLS
jgi:hypothetical protein